MRCGQTPGMENSAPGTEVEAAAPTPLMATTDFEPPAACINRIVKAALPDSTQVTREAKTAFAKAAGIFIIYLTTCANDVCKDKKRQTVSAADVLQAFVELELDDMKETLQDFLTHFRAAEGTKRKEKGEAAGNKKLKLEGGAAANEYAKHYPSAAAADAAAAAPQPTAAAPGAPVDDGAAAEEEEEEEEAPDDDDDMPVDAGDDDDADEDDDDQGPE